MSRCLIFRCLIPLAGLLLSGASASAADPTPRSALGLKPIHAEVEIDIPAEEEIDRCTVRAERIGELTGWVVRNPEGLLLRRFIDSNGDNKVDTWCYFHNGLEVYRDIDTNHNTKANEHRWLNTAGRRWGVDTNGDGKIDLWKSISAEEVTAEVIAALREKDQARFARLLLSADELDTLGIGPEKKKLIEEKLRAAAGAFQRTASAARGIAPATRWLGFSAPQPGVVPRGTDGSTKDLVVYENVAAMIETSGQSGLVQIGTLVQVGDSWRLLDAPRVAGDEVAAGDTGFFYSAALARGGDHLVPSAGQNESLQKLIEQLQRIDEAAGAAAPAARARLHAQRAGLLERLVEESAAADRGNWVRQLADSMSAAVQAGEFPDGVARLKALADSRRSAGETDLAAYVAYRHLMSEYSIAIQSAGNNFAQVQTRWLKSLEEFVEEFGSSDDAADAMLQLAIAQEFAGEEDEAKQWYTKIAARFSGSAPADKARGAIRRLESVGKPLELKGTTLDNKQLDLEQFRGRVVAVQYWATWCEPCKQDMEELKKLVATYGRQGFNVIGVNLDTNRADAIQYLRAGNIPWFHLYEPGGLDSRLANEMGILTLPTMLLIDQQGRVVNRGIHVTQVEEELRNRLRR